MCSGPKIILTHFVKYENIGLNWFDFVKIQAMEEALNEEDRKEHMQIRGEIEVVKREINGVKKSVASLKRQLLDVRSKKGDAYKVILKLIKIQYQPIS